MLNGPAVLWLKDCRQSCVPLSSPGISRYQYKSLLLHIKIFMCFVCDEYKSVVEQSQACFNRHTVVLTSWISCCPHPWMTFDKGIGVFKIMTAVKVLPTWCLVDVHFLKQVLSASVETGVIIGVHILSLCLLSPKMGPVWLNKWYLAPACCPMADRSQLVCIGMQ
jgi:hypothetical protein